MTEREPWVGAASVLCGLDVDTDGLEHPDEETRRLLEEIPAGMNYQYFTEKMGHPEPRFGWRTKFSDYLRKAHPDEPVKTVLSQPGYRTGPFHWEGRRFHHEELARLQSFPESFEWPETKSTARTLIGNAVPPALGAAVVGAVTGDVSTVDSDDLPSPRRGRTSHQTYRRRTEKRLVEVYGEDVVDD